MLCASVGVVRAQNIEGQIIAAQYGIWRVQGIPQPASGNSFQFVAAACSQIAGNKTFQAFQVGTPIEIFDADPNLNEVVTPSAVSATNQGCSITVTPAHTHNSFSLGSATGGLQEAINANATSPTGNIIVLTAAWYAHGGSSSIITSVQGTTLLNLVDVTKAPYDWYQWNGSVYQKINIGGANIPSVLQMLSGNNAGGALGMPEKKTVLVGGVATVASNEDTGLGLFDCRDPKYDGGCLGPTPGLAMQDLANDLICYNTATGLHANVIFPPGTIAIGTAANPTLKLPTGNRYFGASSGITGTSTLFNATYNNKSALEFDDNLTATCSGSVVTDHLTDGAYVGFGVHGCGQGGCVNVPGDSTTYGTGGPAQTGVFIGDSQGWVDLVGADHNGADGVMIGGIDTHTGNLWGNSNNDYYYFGKSVGPAYNPATDGVHCNICLNSLDGIFDGPNETYGFTNDPGVEYGHAVEVFWGGGMTQANMIRVNRGTIGVQRGLGDGSSFAGHMTDIRIDGTTGPGIVGKGASDYFSGATITNACGSAKVGWSSVASVTATAGSGQTPGTYTLTGSGGLATTGGLAGNGGQAGTNAIIQVIVAAGGTVTAAPTVINSGAKYNVAGPNPTFTLAAGGTPSTFTVTMVGPLAQSPTSVDAARGFCDSVEDISAGGDHWKEIQSQFSFSFGFGPDYATGGVWPFGGGEYDTVYGFYETPGTEQTGQGANIHPQITSIQPVTGATPDVEFGGAIVPSDTSATNITGLSRPWIGEKIDIFGGNVNDTLISTLNGGHFATCSGYNINLALPQTWHFIVTNAQNFAMTATENCNSVDQNHWWVNHAANTASLPPLVQQGTVDSIGDIRAHAMPALPALIAQAGGTPGANGVAGTWVYAYRVWGPWGTQTSVTNTINQCMPLAGFVNNPCFQNERMTLPEGFTRYILTRESSTDGVAIAGTIADVSFTTPQHAASVNFSDTRIAPINTNIIGSANYAANETGGPWECGTLPPVSAYPGVTGQRCDSPATGFRYYADTTDHWKRTTITYANF